jgi:cation/acetate symporter
MVVGGGLSMGAVVMTMFGVAAGGWFGVVMTQPAAVSVPLAFSAMVLVSLVTRASGPEHVARTMVRLHAPEDIDLNRGSFHPERSQGRAPPAAGGGAQAPSAQASALPADTAGEPAEQPVHHSRG